MALAAVVLLPVAYLGSFLVMQVAYGAGWYAEFNPLAELHLPIMEYMDQPDRTGSQTLNRMSRAAYDFGYDSLRD